MHDDALQGPQTLPMAEASAIIQGGITLLGMLGKGMIISATYIHWDAEGVPYDGFFGHPALKHFRGPNLMSVAGYAFFNCHKLTTFKAPKLESIGVCSFYGCPVENEAYAMRRGNT